MAKPLKAKVVAAPAPAPDAINHGLYDDAKRDREVQVIELLQDIRDLLKAKQ